MDFYNGANTNKKLGYNTINSKLNALARKGYLDKRISEFGDQKTVNYVPLKTKREDLSYNNTESETVLSFGLFLEKGFKSWLEHVPVETTYYKLRNNEKVEGQFEHIQDN